MLENKIINLILYLLILSLYLLDSQLIKFNKKKFFIIIC